MAGPVRGAVRAAGFLRVGEFAGLGGGFRGLPGVPGEGFRAPRPKLTVLEIHSVMIGTDDSGEETPKATVWSLDTTAE